MKTMAIRLDDDLHEQLSILSQLEGTTITDIIRASIEAHLVAKRNDPSLAAQADHALAEIEAAANRRREAIGALFKDADPKAPTGGRRGRKTDDGS